MSTKYIGRGYSNISFCQTEKNVNTEYQKMDYKHFFVNNGEKFTFSVFLSTNTALNLSTVIIFCQSVLFKCIFNLLLDFS